MRTATSFQLVVLTVIGLGLTACTGAGSSSAAASSPSAVTSSAPSPSSSPATSPSSAPASVEPAVDPDEAVAALDSLTSYRVAIDMSSTNDAISGTVVVVRKPEFAEDFTVTTDGQQFRIVQIGDKAWIDMEGTGTYEEQPASVVGSMTDTLSPEALLASLTEEGLLEVMRQIGVENKNGVQAVHYFADATAPAGADGQTIPPGATVDLWVAPEGYLVAAEAKNFTTDDGETANFSIQVTNVNDPTNAVSPPD